MQEGAHFSEGDTLSVLWGEEWVECMVVSCVRGKEVRAIYPENSFRHRPHDAIYSSHDLEKVPWRWIGMPAEWEYSVSCTHKRIMERVISWPPCHM